MTSNISAKGSVRTSNSADSFMKLPTSDRKSFIEGGHELEKLEFALAFAESRGEGDLSNSLRDEIEALGGNIEEPGT